MADADAQETFRGVIKGGAGVLDGGVALPDGTQVVVTVRPSGAGSPLGLLTAMAQAPRLDEEDVAALVQEIERGKRPIQYGSPLD